MATKKARDAKAPSQEEKQQIEAEQPPKENGQPTVTKAQAVRDAMARGLDDLDDITAFLKTTYNIEMPRPQISAYKAQAKAKEGGGTPRTRSSPAMTVGIPAGFGSDVREIRALLEKLGGAAEAKDVIGQLVGLVGKYGSSGLTEIIDALG